jgi:hypothetical protein
LKVAVLLRTWLQRRQVRRKPALLRLQTANVGRCLPTPLLVDRADSADLAVLAVPLRSGSGRQRDQKGDRQEQRENQQDERPAMDAAAAPLPPRLKVPRFRISRPIHPNNNARTDQTDARVIEPAFATRRRLQLSARRHPHGARQMIVLALSQARGASASVSDIVASPALLPSPINSPSSSSPGRRWRAAAAAGPRCRRAARPDPGRTGLRRLSRPACPACAHSSSLAAAPIPSRSSRSARAASRSSLSDASVAVVSRSS